MRTVGTALSAGVLMFTGLGICSGAAEPVLPEIMLNTCKAPPKIDGVLDDVCWKQTLVVDRFHVLKRPSEVATKHRAWVTRDNEWLYAAFDIAHPAADRDPPKYFKHDDLVQREDCVKVSFDPGTDGKMYFHFKLNRINVRQERRMSIEKGAEVYSNGQDLSFDTQPSTHYRLSDGD